MADLNFLEIGKRNKAVNVANSNYHIAMAERKRANLLENKLKEANLKISDLEKGVSKLKRNLNSWTTLSLKLAVILKLIDGDRTYGGIDLEGLKERHLKTEDQDNFENLVLNEARATGLETEIDI